MSGTPLLRLENLTVAYGTAMALDDVSLEVNGGETLTILGANGAGKSTLARACCGLVPSDRGRVWFDGEEISSWPTHRIRRSGVTYLPEGRGVLPGLSVNENLRMAVRVMPRPERKGAIERCYELFPVLRNRQSQRAGSLSGGEQQMLSLARGLGIPTRLIIADELSLGLAPKVVDEVFDAFRRAQAMGITIILIEQFIHRALMIADSCTILSRGRVAWTGDVGSAEEEVLRHYIGQN